MYSSLLIVKKLSYAWMYYPNGMTTGFAISKGYLTGDENTMLVQIVEQGKTKRPEVLLENIIVRDEFSGGSNMTFSSFADLQQQLTLMGNPLMVDITGGGVLNPEDNKFISKPGFDIVDNLITVRPNWIWKLVGITYTNPSPVPFLIPYSAAGKSRLEYIIPNNSNGFTRVIGLESTGIPIAPQIPDNGLFVTFYQVTDNGILSPQEPINGDEFVKKIESQDYTVSLGATTIVDYINMFDDRSSLSLVDSITDLKSLEISEDYIRPGKPFYIKNRTDHDVILWHNAGTGNTKMFFLDENDFVMNSNAVIFFILNSNDLNNLKLEHVGTITDLSNYYDKDEVDLKVADIDYSCACSDETSDLTAGTLITFRMPYGMALNTIKLSTNTAPTGSKIIVDIRKGGVSILSTLVSIDTGSTTSVGATVAYVISDSNLADDSVITIVTTLVGSTSAGKGLKVTLIGKKIT